MAAHPERSAPAFSRWVLPKWRAAQFLPRGILMERESLFGRAAGLTFQPFGSWPLLTAPQQRSRFPPEFKDSWSKWVWVRDSLRGDGISNSPGRLRGQESTSSVLFAVREMSGG